MKVNKLIKELKKIRNEYGNVKVKIFDVRAWENGESNGYVPIEAITFEEHSNIITLYQKGENKNG